MENYGLKNIKKTTLVQGIVDQLGHAIASGKFKPGDRLPTEQELAEALGCGRNTVREAVKILSSHGILEVRRAEGIFVARGMNDAMVNPLIYSLILLNGENSRHEMIEFQIAIDKATIRMAAEKRTDADMEELRALYAKLAEALRQRPYNLEQILSCDKAFHFAVSRATHNSFMSAIYSYIWDLLSEVIRDEISLALEQYGDLMLRYHGKQFQGILDQDPELAASAITASYLLETPEEVAAKF